VTTAPLSVTLSRLPGSSIIRCVSDTSPAAQRRYDDLLRQRTPVQRLATAVSLSRAVRTMAVAGIRAAHPNASPREVAAQLAERLYGQEVSKRLFGHLAP
jgi:hypothetical protein